MSARLPVTVVSGYLGAGKTSLVNHLLRHADGRRLLVLVNDFGEINIDADLIESAEGDTLMLSNGCLCCSLGGDLYQALADALDRSPRPDGLIIEASGVAEPGRIAQAAVAEPEMVLTGIVTMADAVNLVRTLNDPLIGAQVAAQVQAADLVVLTRSDLVDAAPALSALMNLTDVPVLDAPFGAISPELILEAPERSGCDIPAGEADHGADYASWSYAGPATLTLDALEAMLASRPKGVYRLKGCVRVGGAGVEVHAVGRSRQTREVPAPPETRLVAIGLRALFRESEMAEAFSDAVAASSYQLGSFGYR